MFILSKSLSEIALNASRSNNCCSVRELVSISIIVSSSVPELLNINLALWVSVVTNSPFKITETDVSKELKGYTGVFVGSKHDPAHDYFLNILKSINLQLWDLEDRKRKGVERYSKEESDVAFLITQLNDLRHETKKRVDSYFKSEFTERKSH